MMLTLFLIVGGAVLFVLVVAAVSWTRAERRRQRDETEEIRRLMQGLER